MTTFLSLYWAIAGKTTKNRGKATINTITNAYGQFYRIQIPMFRIHPSLHQNISGIKLSGAQSKAVTDANEGINNFYENKKVK